MGALNPITTVLPLRDSLQGRDRSGLFSATAIGPVRYREEDGVEGYWAERGATNLATNPVAGINTTNWNTLADRTVTRETSLPKPLPDELASITTGIRFDNNAEITGNPTLLRYSITLTAAIHTIGIWVYIPSSFAGDNLQWMTIGYAGATETATMLDMGVRDDWQYVELTITPLAGSLSGNLLLRQVSTILPISQQLWVSVLQVEQSAHSTSPAIGSLGPGYSWAAMPHASASVRVGTHISVPVTHDDRIDTVQGSMVARFWVDYFNGQSMILVHHGDFTGVNDSVGMEYHTSGVLRGLARRDAANVIASTGAFSSAETWTTLETQWDSGFVRAARDGGMMVSAATGAPTGVPATAAINIGRYQTATSWFNGLIGPILIYDQPLSPQRRAIVLDALANDADMDELWTLFEEWEAIGQPADLLALQSGQATAGVAALALPMDTTTRQAAQATAGVTAEGQAMETGEWGEATALGLDGAKVIPIPDTRPVISIGEP